jgi:hypothetical protein
MLSSGNVNAALTLNLLLPLKEHRLPSLSAKQARSLFRFSGLKARSAHSRNACVPGDL